MIVGARQLVQLLIRMANKHYYLILDQHLMMEQIKPGLSKRSIITNNSIKFNRLSFVKRKILVAIIATLILKSITHK